MNDNDWTHAIAAVIDSKGIIRGTAFFVGPDVALTCNHVLADAGDGPTYLRSVGSADKDKVLAQDRDEELDLALMRVASKPDRRHLTLRHHTPPVGSRLSSYGFPRNREPVDFPDGFPMDPAVVSGETTLIWRGQPVEMLVLVGGDATNGMSGAPALYEGGDTVAGILRFTEKGNQQHAFAIPVAAAMRRWPGLPTEQRALAPSFAELTAIVIAESLASTSWDEFDPALLQCVIIDAEPAAGHEPGESLADLVTEMFSSPKATIIWDSFAQAWEDRLLVRTGKARGIAKKYNRSKVRITSFNVVDAYASAESLDIAVRLIVEADLALFDLTHFQPGVMLLLGIRAATRRAVTINSHGAGWREGEPISRPFNLADLSLASHTPTMEALVGDDPRLDRLAERVRAGFDQFSRQPIYQDLPVYDALRKLGPREDAWTSIPLESEVLALCSYDSKYFPTWLRLRRQVRAALSELSVLTNVARLQDVATPQLVSQSLYERLRRCSGCIADWTLSSPSTFFELGVRIAVSPWGVVQIADEEWFQEVSTSNAIGGGVSQQIVRMRALLNPLVYKPDDTKIGTRIARQLVELRDRIAGSGGHHLRQVAAEALRATEERFPDLFWQLTRDADAFSHHGSVRDNVPQALYYQVREIKADQERAALERRLAAWLYLEHRLGAGSFDESDDRKRLWRELGELVASDLFLSNNEADLSLALLITDSLLVIQTIHPKVSLRNVALQRRKGDALSQIGRPKDAEQAYDLSLSLLDEAIESVRASLSDPGSRSSIAAAEAASDAAELFGSKGGLLRRMGRPSDALKSYRSGADIEYRYDLTATYNRTNAIKLALITGDRTVKQLVPDLETLQAVLAKRLSTDERVADDAWSWADLGDVRLLLGDDGGAGSAYHTFAAKARTDSPTATLSVLWKIANSLQAHEDEAALRIMASISKVEAILG